MEINYVCSLGRCCHTARVLQNNKLKLCSYPFDWIFSNYKDIIHCVQDNFKTFLNKSHYKGISKTKCDHLYYESIMFNHHNPLHNENDYNYFTRCVNRFRNLLQYKEHKLFIMTFVNMENINEHIKNELIKFNRRFSKYTTNYTLLVIFNITNKQKNHHNFTYNKNKIIHFLELHTLSKSNGLHFRNNNDNIYLNNVLQSTYKFNITS